MKDNDEKNRDKQVIEENEEFYKEIKKIQDKYIKNAIDY